VRVLHREAAPMKWAAALRRAFAVEDRTPENESIDVAAQLAQLLAVDPLPRPRRTHAGKSTNVINNRSEDSE
jgi:hypothetical protein